jgi:Caspase domain
MWRGRIGVKRAAVLIGVDHSGDLPVLADAAQGARRMETWAHGQGMDPIEVLTDESGPVDIGAIKRAVQRIVDAGTDQLIVYFAGHGVNIRYGEYWLLSDAPRDTQAAVNLAGSVVLAQYSSVPYVVFVSDACRSAAEGIRAQFVTGSETSRTTVRAILKSRSTSSLPAYWGALRMRSKTRPSRPGTTRPCTPLRYWMCWTACIRMWSSGQPKRVGRSAISGRDR